MFWFFMGLVLGFISGSLLGTICMALCSARKESEDAELRERGYKEGI